MRERHLQAMEFVVLVNCQVDLRVVPYLFALL